MCDNGTMWGHSPWNTHFYHQYLQQHARMTQWIENLHQNILQPLRNSSNHGNHTCHHHHRPNLQLPVIQGQYIPQQGHTVQQGHDISQQEHHIPQQGYHIPNQGYHIPNQGYHITNQGYHIPNQGYGIANQGYGIANQGYHVRHQRRSLERRGNSRHNSHYDTHHRSRSQTSNEYVKDDEIYKQEEDSEDDSSDGELVLNVDAILAFRAQKGDEEEDKEEAKSEESFELVDTVLDENFEFVELDDAGQLQKVFGRPSAPDAKGDVEYDREARIVLYGDRADRIAGLETSLEIMFDHFNDLHQPVVFPHV